MMKVPEYKKLNRGDVPGMPPAFYVFMEHFQEQLNLLSQAANARLTVADNFLAEPVHSVQLRHGNWSELKLGVLRAAPSGVIVLQTGLALTGFEWRKINQGRIQVRALFEGAPTDPVRTILEIRG